MCVYWKIISFTSTISSTVLGRTRHPDEDLSQIKWPAAMTWYLSGLFVRTRLSCIVKTKDGWCSSQLMRGSSLETMNGMGRTNPSCTDESAVLEK